MRSGLIDMLKRSLIVVLLLALVLAALAFWPQAAASDGLSAEVLATAYIPAGFARAEGPRAFSFPFDFGPHPDFQTEWWYYTGHLESSDGHRFGYQLSFFRRALLPIELAPERDSQWATNQIYMGHFALTDIDGEDFYAYERFARGAAGLAGASNDPYSVWLEDWRVEQTGPDTFSLYAASNGIVIVLDLVDSKGPILQGDDGYSQKGPEAGNASYYYSQTRLQSSGRLQIGEQSYQVEGLSWKDHEISTSALSTDQAGWDWFSIQLDNGYELMLYQLRGVDGRIDPYSSGALIGPNGEVTHLALDDFDIEALGSWQSPHSGAEYPMGWRIRIPQADLELEIEPHLTDQELRLSFTYWEGAVQVRGRFGGETVSGQGYVELTGYAEPLGGQF